MITDNLRPYQKEVHDKVLNEIRKSTKSLLVEAVTASGKSWIIAALAETIHNISKKNILCLAPNVDLVKQNREKYLTTGQPASIYSASAGVKCLKHSVVFSTPLTAKNISNNMLSRFAMIVIDEAHSITNTIIEIIERAKNVNPLIRVVGLTGTPFKLGKGRIYKVDENDKALGEDDAINPYFDKLVCRITAQQLLDLKYITPVEIGATCDKYESIHSLLQKNGMYKADDINRVYLGKGRKTAYIVGEIVLKTREHKGVMIFATTIKHGLEIMESLPKENSRFIGGDINMTKKEREKIIDDFKKQKYKYLVNVSVLTTGVDFTHVDCIAILRPTESASLFLQIIGRGLRLHNGKEKCLLLDYASNIDYFFPEGDIFNPNIKTKSNKGEKIPVEIECPSCRKINIFSARKNTEGYILSNDGYFLDLENNPIIVNNKPLPSHYGRSCLHECGYRWSYKVCECCNYENDITARYCKKCKGELIDPNEKLVMEFKALKKDPTEIQIDKVIDVSVEQNLSTTGNEVYKVNFVTEYRAFAVWFMKYAKTEKQQRDRDMFIHYYYKQGIKTVEYKKTGSFYNIYSYNKEEQKCQANI